MKSPFIISVDFESILIWEVNGKQNPDESYTSKYKNMFLTVIVTNQHVLMINLVSLLSYI